MRYSSNKKPRDWTRPSRRGSSTVEPISYGFSFYHKNRLPYSDHYELSLERQIGSKTVLSASYVGNQGHRLITLLETNPGSPSICNQVNTILDPGTCSQGDEEE